MTVGSQKNKYREKSDDLLDWLQQGLVSVISLRYSLLAVVLLPGLIVILLECRCMFRRLPRL